MLDIIFKYAMRALVMLIAIPVHECAHAFISNKLGDDTAKKYGRMTLNPLAHFDPLGALCMVVAGFGWAKPVPIGANRFKHPKLGMAISALAGPVSNILLALISIIGIKLIIFTPFGTTKAGELLYLFFSNMVFMNISLAVFNFIPVPPLDGSRIFLVFLPQHIYFGLMKYERYMMLALFVMLMGGFLDIPISYANNFVFDLLNKATLFVDLMFRSVAL